MGTSQSRKRIIDISAFEKRLYLSFLFIVVVLIIVFSLLLSNYNKAKDSSGWVEHTWKVLYNTERLNQQYKDIVAQSRGYALTGNSVFKEQLVADTKQAWLTLSVIRRLTSDKETQQKALTELESLLHRRADFAVQLIRIRDSASVAECIRLIEKGEGQQLSARIDSIIEVVQAREKALLAERVEANESSGRGVFFVIWLLLIVLVLMLLLVVYIVVNTVRTRAKMAEDLRTSELQAETLKGEKKYREALDNMMEGIQIIDRNWKYVYVNDSLVKQAKFSREQLLGHTMMDRYPGIEKTELFAVLRKCMHDRHASVMENEFYFPDGSLGCFQLSIQPVNEGLFILSIDISERKKAENELKKLTEELEHKVKERTAQLTMVNDELESFSYSVSHDLRAPLRAISGYSSILEEDYAAKFDEEGKRVLQVIQDNVKRMGDLINDLLAFSRMGKHDLNKTELDMNKLADAVVNEQLQNYKGTKPSITIKPLSPAFADESMIRQVFSNLVSNAIKYSSKKAKPEIEIGSYPENDEVVFYVKDNGEGFSMDYYDRLFGVFQRLHEQKDFEGTGVGLALVKRIISRHLGRIWAEAKVREGATFYFSLPDKNKL